MLEEGNGFSVCLSPPQNTTFLLFLRFTYNTVPVLCIWMCIQVCVWPLWSHRKHDFEVYISVIPNGMMQNLKKKNWDVRIAACQMLLNRALCQGDFFRCWPVSSYFERSQDFGQQMQGDLMLAVSRRFSVLGYWAAKFQCYLYFFSTVNFQVLIIILVWILTVVECFQLAVRSQGCEVKSTSWAELIRSALSQLLEEILLKHLMSV